MILVTTQAQTQLAKILLPGSKFRILVKSGGCSGFERRFEICNTVDPADQLFDQVVIDSESLALLGTASLDYQVSLGEQKFVLNIPDATVSCGCGKSFNF